MKKIFLGGSLACGVHCERQMTELYISDDENFVITKDYREADIIVIIDTCMSNYDTIIACINYVEKVLHNKKESASIFVSGCLAKGLKFQLPEKYRDILNQVTLVPPDEIIEKIVRMIKPEVDEQLIEELQLPFDLKPHYISLSPVTGCLNNCSFCKSNYMNFDLKSIPYKKLEKLVTDIIETYKKESSLKYINIHSSNLSLYGVDLYGTQRCHDAIKLLTSPETFKFAHIGALINWYPSLIDEILNNPKIKSISISIESGSERVYNLMNRPITLNQLIEIIKLIRKQRPDILINTEFICGYPTETLDDLKKSIDLICELDVNPQFIHPYCNSPQVPSSNLPQHTFGYCVEAFYYANEKLEWLKNKYETFIQNGEMIVLGKDEESKAYVVLLIDGRIKNIRFDQIDQEYNKRDVIPSNSIKNKQLVKRNIK